MRPPPGRNHVPGKETPLLTTNFNPMRIQVFIVEDENLYRDLLQLALGKDPHVYIAGAYADPHEALSEGIAANADVAILDIDLASDINGFELALRLRRQFPNLGIVLLSNFEEEAFIASFRRRAMTGWAYLLKKSVADVDTLVRAVHGVAGGMVVLDPALVNRMQPKRQTGGASLTPRQREILGFMAQGYSNRAIGERLNIAVKSVENHMSEILSRLQVNTHDTQIHPRVAAVLRYIYEHRLG